MSWAVVRREQAEEYAKENNVTLMEAKEILTAEGDFRMQPIDGYNLTFDQDGFWNGTEPNENKIKR